MTYMVKSFNSEPQAPHRSLEQILALQLQTVGPFVFNNGSSSVSLSIKLRQKKKLQGFDE